MNKIITAAAALQTNSVTPEERFMVPASVSVGPFVIRDDEIARDRGDDLGDIITHSSNVGSTMVADEAGSANLGSYMDRFGYGALTGIGFPGEATGTVPTAWDDVIRASASFGQGVSVTPLQMADVYATIANGGRWIQPAAGARHRSRPTAPSTRLPPRPSTRSISSQTSAMLSRMLAEVVQDGTGVAAQIPGYQVAGKTGTSRMIDAATGRYVDRYIASFVGFLPAGSPGSSSPCRSISPRPCTGASRRRRCSPRSPDTRSSVWGSRRWHRCPLPPTALSTP